MAKVTKREANTCVLEMSEEEAKELVAVLSHLGRGYMDSHITHALRVMIDAPPVAEKPLTLADIKPGEWCGLRWMSGMGPRLRTDTGCVAFDEELSMTETEDIGHVYHLTPAEARDLAKKNNCIWPFD